MIRMENKKSSWFCQKCGSRIDDLKAVRCKRCGEPIKKEELPLKGGLSPSPKSVAELKLDYMETLKKLLLEKGFPNTGNFNCEMVDETFVCWCRHLVKNVEIFGDIAKIVIDTDGNIIEKYSKFFWSKENKELLKVIDQILSIDPSNFVVDLDRFIILVFTRVPVFNLKSHIDRLSFYKFKDDIPFPVACFVIWTKSGKIRLFNAEGKDIGYGIPPPSNSITISGPDQGNDVWINWRENAEYWFNHWSSGQKYSLPLGNKLEILNAISDPINQFYYAIAHGDYSMFMCSGDYVYSDDIKDSMYLRYSMGFCFLGHCKAMNSLENDSFTCSFTKVNNPWSIINSVVLGYRDMDENYEAWIVSLQFQDFFFSYIYQNPKKSFYEAYKESCFKYPSGINAIIFAGDRHLTLHYLNNLAYLIRELHEAKILCPKSEVDLTSNDYENQEANLLTTCEVDLSSKCLSPTEAKIYHNSSNTELRPITEYLWTLYETQMEFDPKSTRNYLPPFFFFNTGQDHRLQFKTILCDKVGGEKEEVIEEREINKTITEFKIPQKSHQFRTLSEDLISIELCIIDLDTGKELTRGRRPIINCIQIRPLRKSIACFIKSIPGVILINCLNSLITLLISRIFG